MVRFSVCPHICSIFSYSSSCAQITVMAFKPRHCLKAVCSAHLVIFSTLIPFLPLLSTLPSLLFAVSLFSKPHLLFLRVTQKTHTYIHKVLITRNGLTESLLVCSQVMIFNHSYSNTHVRDNKLCWWLYVEQDFAATRHTHLVQGNRPTVKTNGQNDAVISGTNIISVDGQMLWLKMMIDSGPVQLPYCYIKDLIEEYCVLILSSEAQWMRLHSFALVFAVAEWLRNTLSLPAPQIMKHGQVPWKSLHWCHRPSASLFFKCHSQHINNVWICSAVMRAGYRKSHHQKSSSWEVSMGEPKAI